MLFACIHLPDFPVQALLPVTGHGVYAAKRQSLISFKVNPIAVLDGPESLLKVFACNEAARQAGIEVGMKKARAEACPLIVLLKRVAGKEQARHNMLLDCGYSFSPRVESICLGTVIIDLSGSERLLGPDIGQQLLERAEACSFEANVALAANPDVALHCARGFAGITLIHPGEEARKMGCLPVGVLEPSEEVADALDSWGIRNFKSLAALPSIPLTQRFGQYGLYLQQLTRGESYRELVPVKPVLRLLESTELEKAVELLEPLGFILNRLLVQAVSQLVERSLATDHLRVDLELEINPDRQIAKESVAVGATSIYQRTLNLPVPTQDAKILLKLLQLDLAAHPPPAPIKRITIEAFPAQVRIGQTGLFQPLAPEAANLEITMARLRAVVGEKDEQRRDRVGFPAVPDSHKPDSFQISRSLGEAKETKIRPPGPCLAIRLFRPALAAKVEVNDSTPAAVIFRGKKAKVLNATGPWRRGGAWWGKAEQWQREEWDLKLNINGGMGIYRMFREPRSDQWFMEGIYD